MSIFVVRKLKTMKNLITVILLIVTSVVFSLHNFIPSLHTGFVLQPENFKVSQLLTAMFTHNSVFHFLISMLVLFVIGTKVEIKIGSKKFLIGFLLVGILSNVLWVLFSDQPVAGMSGATYGLLAMFIITHKEYKTHLTFLPKYKFSIVYLLLGVFLLELLLMFFSNMKVAHSMHLTGMIIGTAYIFLVNNKELNDKN